MAISLPDSSTSYDFQTPQQYAIHLRLTPEVKEALLRAQQQGEQASLQLTGHAADNRSTLQVANKQHALVAPQQQQQQDHQAEAFTKHSKGHLKSGFTLSHIQAVKPPTQHQKPHAEQQNGTAAAVRAADPPARQAKLTTTSPVPPSTARHASHAGPSQQPLAHSQQHKQPMNSSMQFLGDPKHLSADPKQALQPSQNAPPGSSLQSAQTALPQKPSKGKPAKAPAPAAASLLTDEVVQQVCAAARIGQKETVLIALLQCKPCKNQVLEAVLKEAEKRVPGFQRLQGESLKRACRSYGEMKPGNKWALQSQYLQPAQAILTRIQTPDLTGDVSQMQQPSGPDRARKSAEPQPGAKRKRSAEPQPAASSWHGGSAQGTPLSTEEGDDNLKNKRRASEPGIDTARHIQEEATDALPSAKKKKRLRKAGDMERGSQSEESDKAAPTRLKQSLQVAGLEDSDSKDAAIPGSHGLGRHPTFPQTHHSSPHMAATAAARRPPPGSHELNPLANRQRDFLSDLRHPGYQDSAHGHHRHATDDVLPNAKAVHQSHTADRQRLGDNAGPSGQMFGAMHAGFSRSGNLTGDLTGLNAQMDDRDASGAGPSAVAPVPEPAPAIGKIKLKVRRPVSAASEAYDESWFAEHLDRQPELQAPIQNLAEWEQCVKRYDAKQETYFRLHQEIQDLKIKVTGLQQAMYEAPEEAEKALLQQQFESYWEKRLHRSQRWDKAFTVLHQELQAMFSCLQSFFDAHAHVEKDMV